MDDPSVNHYERQLYSMFKSFDVNNEESLDESAVSKLCVALQLDERGATLVDGLFERHPGRVSFAQFRSGLLAVLGERAPPEPPPSDEDASSRELAPRFVFGSKKYGRRSRPPRADEERPGPRAASASRLEAGERAAPRFRRSSSAMDARDDEPALEHARRVRRDEALALCRSLRMDSIDARIVDRVFDDAQTAETSVGEFFDRLNSSLASAVAEGVGEEEPLAGERVTEAWERAGVRRPRRLLAELGFAGGSARAADLERALDDELRAFDEPLEARAALLAAALAVSRLRAADAARRRDLAAAERDKLRSDVAEANERARLLAQEVDESHARIENELKASAKRAAAKHAEETRRAAADAAAELERAAAESARLESELARRTDAEVRLRAELDELRARADELEARALAAEQRCAAAEREATQLGARLREAEAAAAGAAEARAEAETATARATELALETQRLRDRADELAAALERAPPSGTAATAPAPPADALAAELGGLLLDRSPDARRVLPRGEEEAAVEGDEGSIERVRAELEGDEARRLAELVKELEASLEAMRGEYEACEEYWARKLRDERAAHETEARAADRRLADLVARIADFERRLAPPALPPIPEAAALEAQVADLEAEFARYRRGARARLAALAAAARPAAAPELAARCARAEAAARRLHARLLAADALVKDLYVENCRLHARALAAPPPPDAADPMAFRVSS